ncbi:general substrate transporter [Xylariales sp. AK1849]|nr:general substrate transporter [Xylariales sp. AK1849]
MKNSPYNILVVLAACIGSLTYGYVISILATTLSKADFYTYMNFESTSSYATAMVGVWMCVLYFGALVGSLCYSWVAYQYGRKLPILWGSAFVDIGGALQAGSVYIPMLTVSRFMIGVGIGFLLPASFLYQAEVAPARARGSALGFGNMVASWIGCAFFYADGQLSWRIPQAIQCVFQTFMFVFALFLPESPRWPILTFAVICSNGRQKEVEATMIKLHKTKSDPIDSFARKEFIISRAQLDLDLQKKTSIWKAMSKPSQRKRFILGFLAMMGTQYSGLDVLLVSNFWIYSTVIYTGLGFSPFMATVMAGLWTTMNGLGNLAGALIADSVGRRRHLMGGYIGVTIGLLGATILTKFFAGTESADNKAAVFFIFWIIVMYPTGIEAASFFFVSEIFPSELRAQGVAFSMQGLFLSSILWSSVASPALANIGWHFYIVFIATSIGMFLIVYLFFPEVSQVPPLALEDSHTVV